MLALLWPQDDIWVDVGEEALHRSPPLLALLPACLADVPLAHNICALLRRLVDKVRMAYCHCRRNTHRLKQRFV